MPAKRPRSKVVAVQAGVTTTNGTGGIPNAGFRIHAVPMPVNQYRKPWIPRWHQAHPKN